MSVVSVHFIVDYVSFAIFLITVLWPMILYFLLNWLMNLDFKMLTLTVVYEGILKVKSSFLSDQNWLHSLHLYYCCGLYYLEEEFLILVDFFVVALFTGFSFCIFSLYCLRSNQIFIFLKNKTRITAIIFYKSISIRYA